MLVSHGKNGRSGMSGRLNGRGNSSSGLDHNGQDKLAYKNEEINRDRIKKAFDNHYKKLSADSNTRKGASAKTGGSRFDILSDNLDEMLEKFQAQNNNKNKGKEQSGKAVATPSRSGKKVLVDISNNHKLNSSLPQGSMGLNKSAVSGSSARSEK
ncbi:hypothetical protein ACOSQ3_019175 [Xanthoceras sorbifolium]